MRIPLAHFASRLGIAVLVIAGSGSVSGADNVKKITQAQALSAAVEKSAPGYSAVARQLKLEGSVEVNVFISEEGAVERVESVSGNPILIKSATDALKHWKFRSIQEDGKAVKAVAPMSFSFKF